MYYEIIAHATKLGDSNHLYIRVSIELNMYNLYFIDSYAIADGRLTRKALGISAAEYDVVLFDKRAKAVPIATRLRLGSTAYGAENTEIIRFSDNDYFICPRFRYTAGETNVIRQKQLGKYNITIYDNGEKSLLIESEEYFFNTFIKDDDLKFSLIGAGNTLVCVRGNNILILLDEKLDLIYMDQNAEYSLGDDGFETIVRVNGIIARIITERYSYDGELKSRVVEYPEGVDYANELRAHAFMEAILCGDYAYARDMLADDMRDSIEDIAIFLGEPVEMVIDGDLPFASDKILLRYVDGYKLYSIEIEDERITNLKEI